MPASAQHNEYTKHLTRWQRVRDCVEGEDAIKARSKGSGDNASSIWGQRGTAYLPPPNPSDESAENIERYQSYRDRAVFTNYTGSTLIGLKGLVFRKPPVINLPTGLEYMLDNANAEGLGLSQLMQKTLDELSITGGEGLLADYPRAAAGLSQAQVRALDLKAHIKCYRSESIVNWREEVINGRKQLTLVVLAEQVEKVSDDGFSTESVTHHRALMLREGVYIQMEYDEDDNPIQQEDGEFFIVPRKPDGSMWDFIPFCFVGSENNDAKPDKSLLLDIANVNIAHYRNSADKEESSFTVGQPTLAISGLTQSWVEDVLKGKVLMGSRGGIPLPQGASAQLLQANANQMPAQGMKDKEAEMVALGARIIRDVRGNETAEAAKIRFAGQNSLLAIAVNNIEEAYTKILEWCALFMGEQANIEIELNRQFYDATIDPQQIAQMIVLMDRGVIGMDDIRHNLRQANIIIPEKTDEELDSEVDEIDPLA